MLISMIYFRFKLLHFSRQLPLAESRLASKCRRLKTEQFGKMERYLTRLLDDLYLKTHKIGLYIRYAS